MTIGKGTGISIGTWGYLADATGGGSSPVPPTVTAAAGDGQVILTLTPAAGASSLPMRVWYAPVGGALLSGGSRTGAGALTVSGLTNGVQYLFFASHQDGSLVGAPSNFIFAWPYTTQDPAIIALARAVAAEVPGAEFSYAPDMDVTIPGVTRVFAVAVGESIAPLQRGAANITRQVGVIWLRKCRDQSEINYVFSCRVAARDRLYRARLLDQWCSGADFTPFYDLERLREKVIAVRLLLTFSSFGAVIPSGS